MFAQWNMGRGSHWGMASLLIGLIVMGARPGVTIRYNDQAIMAEGQWLSFRQAGVLP